MNLSLRNLAVIPCLAAFLAVAGSAHATSLVTNGTFSSGLTGWTTSGGGTTPGIGITAINLGGPGQSEQYGDVIPDDGAISTAVYFVDDNANENLFQTVTLAANTSYDLTFDLLGVPSGAGNQFNFTLSDSVGALASSSFSNAQIPTNLWTAETLAFTTGAVGGPYTLNFNFVSGATPAKDVAFTNVALTAVPEPSSFFLLGSGLLGAAGAIRRRFSK